MRYIPKSALGPHALSRPHSSPPTTSSEATRRWNSFRNKQQVLDFLLREQFYLCCYSEIRADEEGLGYHVEHVENKSQNPARTFDYSNISASALDSQNGLKNIVYQGLGVFGGHAKLKQLTVDFTRFVSCHDASCQDYFLYLSDGRVVPQLGLSEADRECAEYTIDVLNLNSPYLVTRRQRWWDELDALYAEHQVKGWSLTDLAETDLVPTNGRLSRFFSLTKQFYGGVANSILGRR